MTQDKKSRGTLVGEETKAKTGSGQLWEFPWNGWEPCLDIKGKRKKNGTSKSSGSHLRCEIELSSGASLMEVWWGAGSPDGPRGPGLSTSSALAWRRSLTASVPLLEGHFVVSRHLCLSEQSFTCVLVLKCGMGSKQPRKCIPTSKVSTMGISDVCILWIYSM